MQNGLGCDVLCASSVATRRPKSSKREEKHFPDLEDGGCAGQHEESSSAIQEPTDHGWAATDALDARIQRGFTYEFSLFLAKILFFFSAAVALTSFEEARGIATGC